MTLGDIPAVMEIENRSFPTPWGERSFRHEILENPYASLFVAIAGSGSRVIAYACVWFVDQEMKINNIAVDPAHRTRGIGTQFLTFLIDHAVEQRCLEASLEVRPSNEAALRLYGSAGFRSAGRRRDYYNDTHEDALIMVLSLRGREGS